MDADLPVLGALRSWLDSWRGIGDVERGMAHQGYDLQLARYRLRLLADGRVLVQLARLGRRHESSALRAARVPGEACRAEAAPADEPNSVPRSVGPARSVASRIVPGPAMQTLEPGASPEQALGASADEKTGPPRQTRHGRWADLMRRAFDIDVLACPYCGNRMRLLATIEDPRVVEQILTHPGAAERAGAGGSRPRASIHRHPS